ncbi:MAG: AAA family ATPase [Candidatus Brocadiia bacterium]
MLADGKGRAELLVLDRLQPAPRREPDHTDGVRGRLSELVSCEDAARPAVELLLGNVFLVENADAALALLEAGLPADVRLVTPEGALYGADGLWAGGKSDRPSLISRRSELNALEEEIAAMDAALAELAERKAAVQSRARELEDRRDALDGRLEALRQEAGDLRSQLKVAEDRAEKLEQELELSDTERAAVKSDLEELDGREDDLQRRITAATEERETAQKEVEERRRHVAEMEEEEQELSREVGELTTEVARTRERHDNLRNLLERLRSDRRQAQTQLENLRTEKEANTRRQKEAREAARKACSQGEALQKRMESLRSTREERAEKVEELRGRIGELTERTRELGDRREQHDEKLQNLRMAEREKAVQIEDLLERTAEDYGVRLKAFVAEPEAWRDEPPFLTRRIREWHEPETRPEPVAQWYRDSEQKDEPAEEEEVELVSLEEAVELREKVLELADDPETDWDGLKTRIAKLKAKVDRVGNVNVDAIRQQDELETRLQFLTDQKEDLEKAQRHEREIIRELNKTSRERFRETFDQVRENFQTLFRKLFGGGNADLVLDPEEEDILEAGIDITARPPGKETNSITLLSGGEKAMTTVALLFAIFQAKPSPFCLLDEVDAPLDDSNVERFLRLLEDFRRDTQFIIVTHNKLTMGVAEILYGITMADGVTRKISVRFEEVDQHLDTDSPPRAKAG